HLGNSTQLATGDRVIYTINGDGHTAVGGLVNKGEYYVRSVGGGNFKLYKTAADANTDTNAIDLTSAGTGTQQIAIAAGIESGSSATKDAAVSGDRSQLKSQGQVNTPSVDQMNLTGSGAQNVNDPSLTGIRSSGVGTQN